MARKKGFIEIIIEVTILLVFIPIMFYLGTLTGIGYIIALVASIYTGKIFKRKKMARLIVVGTFLTFIAFLFLPYLIDSFTARSYTRFAVLLLIALYIWLKGNKMKKGKRN